MSAGALPIINLFFAGVLAGEEAAICLGVRRALAGLQPRAHIEVRQALILKLRVLVPGLIAPTLGTGIARLVQDSSGSAMALRSGGMIALVAFLLITAIGTVPINQAVLLWNPADPPPEWGAAIRQWETLDMTRMAFALLAFVLWLVAAM